MARRPSSGGIPSFTAPDFRYECWLPVLTGEIPLKAHAHRADDILTAVRIAGEFGLGMTLDHCSEGHLITLGFSPKATFIAAGALTIISSIHLPWVFTKANCPPTTLALPGCGDTARGAV